MRMKHKLSESQIIICSILFILLLGVRFSYGQKDVSTSRNELYRTYILSLKSFEKGEKHFHEGNYKKAHTELKKCLEIFSHHAQAHFYLSNILYQNGDFPQALEHIEEAKANFDMMSDLRRHTNEQNTARIKKQKENLDANLRQLEEEYTAFAGCSSCSEKGDLEIRIAGVKQKISVLEDNLNKLMPSEEQIPADYFYLHGNICFRLKKHQEAQAQYIQSVKINPKHKYAYNNLANLYFIAKQHQRALDCLNKAEVNGVETNPKLKEAILKALKK